MIVGAGHATRPASRPAWRVLVVDDEDDVRASLRDLLLGMPDVHVDEAGSLAGALVLLRGQPYDLIIADERLGDGRGVDLLEWVGRGAPATGLMLMSAHDDFPALVDAVNRAHIHQFVQKPWEPGAFLARVRALLEEQAAVADRVRAFARATAAGEATEPVQSGERQWPPS